MMPGRIAQYCEAHLNLQNAELSEEYFYRSLPFCIIDAVFSLGAKYSSTRNAVIRFCNGQALQRLRPARSPYPDIPEQYSVQQFEEFLSNDDDYELIASEIFNNRQRTSTRNGILKAEAVHSFARILLQHHVSYFQDIPRVIQSPQFESDVCSIPGQTYGTSLKYFFMLAGEDNLVKPDRMILRFLRRIIGNQIGPQNAQTWLSLALPILQQAHPNLTLRELDHEIWKYEKSMA
ncbi:MAG: hypothetical protein ABIJ57_12170 [Pseudomonadota bacterium]|nr:hypothetical protein [Pseudomonadota bacterium]